MLKGRIFTVPPKGLSIDDQELEVIAKSLRDIAGRFRSSISARGSALSTASAPENETDARLFRLSTQCCTVAAVLIEAFDVLKVSGLGGTGRHWNSFRQALGSLWKKEHLNAIVTRLDGLRVEWSFYILVSLR